MKPKVVPEAPAEGPCEEPTAEAPKEEPPAETLKEEPQDGSAN
jgi:hypothetical protein